MGGRKGKQFFVVAQPNLTSMQPQWWSGLDGGVASMVAWPRWRSSLVRSAASSEVPPQRQRNLDGSAMATKVKASMVTPLHLCSLESLHLC